MLTPIIKKGILDLKLSHSCKFNCIYCLEKNTFDACLYNFNDVLNYINLAGIQNFHTLMLNTSNPFTFEDIYKIFDFAKNNNFKIKLKTNGLDFNYSLIKRYKKIISHISISIDSIDELNNIKIGRTTEFLRTLSQNDYLEICNFIKNMNIPLHIVTKVSRVNYLENFLCFTRNINPSLWILIPVHVESTPLVSDYINISREDFHHFLETHKSLKNIKVLS